MSIALPPVSRSLQRCLSAQSKADLIDIDWQGVLRVGRHCGLLARLGWGLQQRDLLDDIPAHVKRAMLSAQIFADAQAVQVRFEAAELHRMLTDINCSPTFLKGAAYVLLDHPVGKGRIFSDIDLLVDKACLSAAERKLLANMWFPEEHDDYDQHYYRHWAHEIPPMRHGSRGTVVDMHHNILPPISGRAPKIGHFQQTRQACASQTFVFSPPALALHSLVHLFFEEDFSKGFRDLSDLHVFFSHHHDDKRFWSELMLLAMETGFARELFWACRYAERLFQSPVPAAFSLRLLAYSPSPLRLKFNDWLFMRVLQPDHPLCQQKGTGLARFVAMVRGYMIKMPTSILLYHLGHKFYKSVFELLLGPRSTAAQKKKTKQLN